MATDDDEPAADITYCATTGCGRATGEGEKFCRKHGGDPLACGICGSVACRGHTTDEN